MSNDPHWERIVGIRDRKKIRKWKNHGLPQKFIGRVAIYFGLLGNDLLDDMPQDFFRNKVYAAQHKILSGHTSPATSVAKQACSLIKFYKFVRCFALLRMLEIFQKDSGQQIYINPLEQYDRPVTGADIIITNPAGQFTKEVWRITEKGVSLSTQLQTLHEMAKTEDSETLVGIIQTESLGGNADQLADFFSWLKKSGDLPCAEIEQKVSFFALQQPVTAAIRPLTGNHNLALCNFNPNPTHPRSVFHFACFALRGYSNFELNLKIKYRFQCLCKGHKPDSPSELICNHINLALDYLEQQAGAFIPIQDVLQFIERAERSLLISSACHDLDMFSKSPEVPPACLEAQRLFATEEKELCVAENLLPARSEQFGKALQVVSHDFMPAEQNVLLMLGSFGHVKNILLHYLTALLDKLHTPGSPIPVFMSVNNFFKNRSVKKAVRKAVEPFFRLTDDLWRKGKWIIFCDGDEEQ